MANSSSAFGNRDVFDTEAKKHAPKTSWWIGASREEFSRRAADEQERMAKSKFGRADIKNLTTGGNHDPRAALLSHRRANAPTVVMSLEE